MDTYKFSKPSNPKKNKRNNPIHYWMEDYLVTKFNYKPESDSYTCPQGKTLTTTGTWHKKTRERDSHLFKKHRTPECKTCPAKDLCTGRKSGGREIERSEYADAVEANISEKLYIYLPWLQ